MTMSQALYRINYYLTIAMGKRMRVELQEKAQSFKVPIFQHVLKLTLYGNLDSSWVDDIINWLQQINDLSLDSKGKRRLTPVEYQAELYRNLQHSTPTSLIYLYRRNINNVTSKIKGNHPCRYNLNNVDESISDMLKKHELVYTTMCEEVARPANEANWPRVEQVLLSLTV